MWGRLKLCSLVQREDLKGLNFGFSLMGRLLVDRKYNVKYLGVFLDANINGSVHAGNPMKVCAGRLAFLDASSHLYKRVCPLVGWLVGRSVGR